MYRRYVLTRGAALCCAGAAAALAPTRSRAASAKVEAQRVAEGIYFVEGEAAMGSSANRNFISNAGFVVTDVGVVVIDALGSPALAQELLEQIKRITPRPVTHVIVTHYHADHIYGLQTFKAVGARIVAHAAGRAYLTSETAQLRMKASRDELFPWIDEHTRLVAADDWLDAPETTLRVGGVDLRLRHGGPAHTPEDLGVFLPAQRVLFSGDLVYRGRIPFVGQADSSGWIASLDRLLKDDAAVMVPGHGAVSTAPRDDLAVTRDYLAHLRESMRAAARNLEPFDEAYAKTDWSRFERLPLFKAVNRSNAYNTYLLMEQQALK